MSSNNDSRDLKPDLRQSAAEFDVLVETGRRLTETTDLPTILQAAVDGVTGLAGLDTAAVYLLEGDVLHLGATYPPLPADFPTELRDAPLSDHLHIRETLEGKKLLLVDDLRQTARTRAEREVARQRNLRTVLYVPLVVDGDGLGAFLVGSTGQTAHIAENCIGLVQALANLAALTARNARLFNESQAKTRELQASLEEKLQVEKDREELREQLAQAQKLESIGRLAGGVAHDFNNLLQVIQGYTDLAMAAVGPVEPANSHLLEVRAAAERSAGITRQLLAFARRQTIAPKVLDLNESVESILQLLKPLLGEDLDLVWVPERTPLPVFLDPSQLDQVLTNLCVNARDAIADVGKVTIETLAMTIGQEYCDLHEGFQPGRYCMLAVSDDGCGFDPEVRDRIFEPFFTTKQDGTGLGLAMVYGVVKQNNGFIHVYSEPGHGTTFKIYLRHHEGEERPVAASSAPSGKSGGGGETVLVVEDDPAILKFLKTILTRRGYSVLAADSPQRALELAAGHSDEIQLLLTDVILPEINGRELAEKIGAQCPGLAVLYMSGYTSNVIAHRGVLEEDVSFIQKPFSPGQLVDMVQELLGAKEE